MPFINEIPSAEDIEKYGLLYKNDLNLDMKLRRQWTMDRERNFHLYGGGATGNQAFEEIIDYRFYLYLNGSKLIIETPDVPQTLLDNDSLNQFIAILKEAVTVHSAGYRHRHIHIPVVVRFGF
ncbi:hypothetical protein FUT69_04965 [Xylella taiwanensis]|uniref:Uncharacterized protein n=1 Tax=Xylella taiwanensis TaxID=1444770 RepID=Z9JK70_9GAMM|nr:hypothetical protein [Xylella taiwanensis]AXI82773.1 hypothetical protein AB672_01725 [Xylella taiwanensis]EWS78534.1 hypothetical protein AF72_04610 [Xylella taiwanensis]MCD8455781.1 hypothetical protein [Xylella taiwanensis]MCD8458186.1 hypothetical protein [Xylella taiwanensis]MCD8460322.1 hypothetical protein [Xylella taiwanensis]